MTDLVRITALTEQLGISSRSLRYYEQVGLIHSIRSANEKYLWRRLYRPTADANCSTFSYRGVTFTDGNPERPVAGDMFAVNMGNSPDTRLSQEALEFTHPPSYT